MRKNQKGFTPYDFRESVLPGQDPAAEAASPHNLPVTTSFMKNRSGFTLIEILLVIGIIAVLATVVVVALDPLKRFQDARDARRHADIESISTAIAQYVIDNKGQFPSGVENPGRQLGTESGGCIFTDIHGCTTSNVDGCLDLSTDLARYLKDIPFDPRDGNAARTGYMVELDSNNIVTVRACNPEVESEISVSR